METGRRGSAGRRRLGRVDPGRAAAGVILTRFALFASLYLFSRLQCRSVGAAGKTPLTSRELQFARTFAEEERRNPIEIPRELKFAARFDVGLQTAELLR